MKIVYNLIKGFSSSEPSRDNWDNWTIVFCTLSAEKGGIARKKENKYIDVSNNNYSIIIIYIQ